MNTMGKWQIKDVSIESPSAEPEYWEAIVELEHADDCRRLEIALDAEVRCDITLDGEKVNFEGFLSDADLKDWLNYYVESGDFTEEEALSALGREYWAYFNSSTITAIEPDGSTCHVGEREEILSYAIEINYTGDAFDACGWLTDGLETAIERELKAAARNEVAFAEYWADEAYSALVENGEHIKL